MSKLLSPVPDPLADACATVLGLLDPDPDRSGLDETPKRMARSLEFLTRGYDDDPVAVLKTFEDGAENYDQMVFQGAIPFYSLCEHHLLPFWGFVHIGYIPTGRVVGLSKLSRLTGIFSRRLQIQERLTNDVASCFDQTLQSAGTGVVIRARHMCIEMRGVERLRTVTTTSALLGEMRTDARAEFLGFVDAADRAVTL